MLGFALFVLKKHTNITLGLKNGILLPNLWSFWLMPSEDTRVNIFSQEFSVRFVFHCDWPPPFKGKQTWLFSWLTAAFISKFSLKERRAAWTLNLDVAALLERVDLGVGGEEYSLGSAGAVSNQCGLQLLDGQL